MSPRPRRALVIVQSVCVLALASAPTQGAPAQPWRDPSRSPAQRADALLAALTEADKIAIALNDFAPIAAAGGPSALPNDDGPSGIRADGTTAFPSAQTLASTFDRSLARQYGDAIATEARGKGFDWWLGPAMDIARTPLAGRQPENLGEDPFLAGETVAQEVAAAKARHVIATLKHYVANNQETERIGFRLPPAGAARSGGINVLAAERTLQEIYEAPFKPREPPQPRRRGHVLVQPAQRAADVREPGAAVRPQGVGVRRVRGAGLHLRRPRPARGDARRRRRPGAQRPERADRRDVHVRPGAAGAPRRHRPPAAVRAVRLGRVRRPGRAGAGERLDARAPRPRNTRRAGRHGGA